MNWKSDTCGCEFQYDPSDISFIREVDLCDIHKSLGGRAAFGAVIDECARKNFALAKFKQQYPKYAIDLPDDNGGVYKEFVKKPQWSFDAQRNLHIVHDDITIIEKVILQDEFDKDFGKDKAKID